MRTISVAVHVVYNNSSQNVSTASINNLINTLNADFRRTNSDASQTRAAFLPVAADAEIEFCLDTIIRRSTSVSCFDPNTATNNMKSNATGGSSPRDTRYFLNIWIVNLCGNAGGGTAGYAYLPTQGMPGSAIDGLVIDYSLGYDNGFGRTATHEIGHYLGLPHPWGSDQNPSCATDDGFSDTPNTNGPRYTCSANNSCGTPAPGDQYENFMDYSFCTNMFTIQQANYMNAILTQVRSSLFSSPGCNSAPQAPVADFTANRTVLCPGQQVTFTNASSGAPTAFSWTFTGATPATSTAQNPTVTYNTPGTYTVSLTVTNAFGTDTETKVNFITVTAAGSLPITQGFQTATFPPAGWQLINPDNSYTWQRTTSAGGYGTSSASMFVNNYEYNAAGSQDLLLLPPVSFVGITNGRLTFDYAYAQYQGTGGSASDSLLIVVSIDCGETFYLLQQKGGAQLATRTAMSGAFTPTSGQWRTDTISLTALAGQANVQIGFLNQTGYGNNLFVDNINLSQPAITQPPVANFSGNPTTVPVGSSVAFTDLSTNSPTSWSWNFSGGTPATSTAQNPTITYNAPGTYTVTLTATNAFGNDSETKVNYITVVQPSAGGCDTIDIFNATDSLALYYAGASPTDGYLSGHNSYGDLAKANRYTPLVAGSTIPGVFMQFGVAVTTGNRNVNIRVWDANGTGGAPGTVLATQVVPINSLGAPNITYIGFTNPPTVNGPYYVGVEFAYAAGDTVALLTNTVFSGNPNVAWEKWSDNSWNTYTTGWGGINLKNIMFPIECSGSVPQPNASFTASATTVCAGATVTYTNTSTNATSYNWTFAGGTPASSTAANPTVTYNTVGTHTVTLVATGTGGQDTETRTNFITVRSNPVPAATVTNVTCNGGTNGAINVTVTGGTAPYTYLWNGGATTPNRTNLAAGSYTVTVTDANGCTGTTTASVTQAPVITLSVTSTAATCAGNNGSATVTATGGTTPYTYAWSTGATTQTINNLVPGTYSVTVTSANGCTALGNTVVSGPTPVTLTTTSTPATCSGNSGSATVTANGGSTPFTYAWSNGGTTATISNLTPGTYTVTVTAANTCTATASVVVAGNIAISLSTTTTQANCVQSNGGVNLTVSGGTAPYTYAWSNGATSQNLTGIAAGSYTVIVTDGAGCTATTSATVTNIGGATVTVSNVTNVTCNGGNNGSITVSATGGNGVYTYAWSNGGGTNTQNNLTAGNYTVTVTDGNGCIATATASVTQPSAIVASVNVVSNVTCFGASNGAVSLTATGGNGNYTFNWSNGNAGASFNNLAAGTYTVSTTDGNGCVAPTIQVVISQPTQIVATTSVVNPGCTSANGSASVTVTGGTPPYSYDWSNGATTAQANNLVAGTYTVEVVDANGCLVTATATLTATAGPSVAVASTPVSCGATNDGTATATVTGGTPPYTYLWNDANNQTSAVASNLAIGTYNVTVTDAASCTFVATVAVNGLGPDVVATPTNVTGCFGNNNGSISLNVSGGAAPYTYAWSNGQTTQNIFTLTSGNYTVTVTDNAGCATIQTITITGPTELTASFTLTPTLQGQSTGAATASVTGGTPPYSYTWSDGTSGTSTSGLGAGNHSLAVMDANGCVETFNFSITVGTDIINLDNKIGIDIYPNPTSGKFVVMVNNTQGSETQVEVYSTLGQQVFVSGKQTGTVTNFEIDLSHLAANTYFVKVVSGSETMVRKVLRAN